MHTQDNPGSCYFADPGAPPARTPRWMRKHRRPVPMYAAPLRFVSAFLVVTMLAWLLPVGQLLAQPANIPGLNTPGFNQTELDNAIDQADQASPNQAAWEQYVASQKAVLAANWEVTVDAQIDSHVQAVAQSDAFNSVAEYQDYVRSSLDVQKRDAFQQWELAADLAIQARRTNFMASASNAGTAELEENAAHNVAQGQGFLANNTPGQDFVQAEKNLNHLEASWLQDFGNDVEAGMQQFQIGLAQLNGDYQSLLASIAQTDAEFQAQLVQIKAYEQNVRDGITTAVDSLDQFLTTSGMFYAENCDADYNCTVDQNTLNASGQELQTLINDLRTGLQNGTPLSTLAQQLTTYTQTQRQLADDTRAIWENRIETQMSYSTYEYPGSLAHRDQMLNDTNNYVGAAVAHMGGNGAPLNALLRGNDRRTVIDVSGVDVCGSSSGAHYQIYPLQIGLNWAGGCYSSVGIQATQFEGVGLGGWAGIPLIVSEWRQEQNLRVTASYKLYDANAKTNRDTWAGYRDSMDPVILKWQNEILPAIQNWEQQVAAYEASYATWQGQAAAAQAQGQAALDQATSDLLAKQNQWLEQTNERFRNDSRQWRNIRAAFNESRSAAAAGDTFRPDARIDNAIAALRDSRVQRRENGTGLTQEDVSLDLPQLDASFFSAARQSTPDAGLISNVAQDFATSLKGQFNVAVVNSLQERSEAIRTRTIAQLAGGLSDQNGILHQMRNLPQAAKDIDEQLRPLYEELEDLAEGSTRYVELQAQIEALQDQRSQVLKDDLPNHTDAGFSVTTDEQGRVILRRQISSGSAQLNAGGNAENYDDYSSVDMEQVVSFAPPPSIVLPNAGDLYEDWDYGDVMSQFQASAETFSDDLEAQFEDISNQMGRANQIMATMERSWHADAAHQAENARTMNRLVMTLFQSMSGGMSFNDAFAGFMEEEAHNLIAASIEESTGLPAGWLVRLLRGAKPHEAAQAYAEDVFYQEVDKQFQLDGAGAYLREWIGKAQERSREHARYRAGGGDLFKFVDQTVYKPLRSVPMNMFGPGGGLLGGIPGLDGALGKLLAAGASVLPSVLTLDPFGAVLAAGIAPEAMKLAEEMGDAYQQYGHMSYDEYMAQQEALRRGDISGSQARRENTAAARQATEQRARDFQRLRIGKLFGQTPLGAVLENAITKPQRVPTAAEERFRTSLANFASESFQIPFDFAHSMLTPGVSFEDAVENQFYANVEQQFGIPGFGDAFRNWFEERMMDRKKHEAARWKPEDTAATVLTMGAGGALTYVWRNAEYDPQLKTVTTIAEVAAAVVVNLVPGVGQAVSAAIMTMVMTAYYAAKQAYLGSLESGTKGAVAGALSGAVTGLSQGAVQMDLGFDENGFGGSIGAGIPIGGGGVAGASINFNEEYGVTGGGLTLGYSGGGGFGPSYAASLGINWNVHGPTTWGAQAGIQGDSGGANIGYQFGQGLTVGLNSEYANINWSETGGFSGGANLAGILGMLGENGYLPQLPDNEILSQLNLESLGYDFQNGLTGNVTGPYGMNLGYGPDGFTGGIQNEHMYAGYGPGGMYAGISPISTNFEGLNFNNLGYDTRTGVSGTVGNSMVTCDVDGQNCTSPIVTQAQQVYASFQNLVNNMRNFDPFSQDLLNPLPNLPDLGLDIPGPALDAYEDLQNQVNQVQQGAAEIQQTAENIQNAANDIQDRVNAIEQAANDIADNPTDIEGALAGINETAENIQGIADSATDVGESIDQLGDQVAAALPDFSSGDEPNENTEQSTQTANTTTDENGVVSGGEKDDSGQESDQSEPEVRDRDWAFREEGDHRWDMPNTDYGAHEIYRYQAALDLLSREVNATWKPDDRATTEHSRYEVYKTYCPAGAASAMRSASTGEAGFTAYGSECEATSRPGLEAVTYFRLLSATTAGSGGVKFYRPDEAVARMDQFCAERNSHADACNMARRLTRYHQIAGQVATQQAQVERLDRQISERQTEERALTEDIQLIQSQRLDTIVRADGTYLYGAISGQTATTITIATPDGGRVVVLKSQLNTGSSVLYDGGTASLDNRLREQRGGTQALVDQRNTQRQRIQDLRDEKDDLARSFR